MPGLVLITMAWAFPTATMRTTDVRGQWWGPLRRLPREVHEDEEAKEDVEVWWGEEPDEPKAGVKMSCNAMRGLQEEDDGWQ